MIPISNLAVAGDIDHGKRSVRSPAEAEHRHHDNHLATWCKHRRQIEIFGLQQSMEKKRKFWMMK